MAKFVLGICADLENLTDLEPEGGFTDPNFTYLFKMKCSNCGEVTQKETCVSLDETIRVPSHVKGKSDHIFHVSQKCKLCLRRATVTMMSSPGRTLTQEYSETGKYAPLMLFDFRGYEPEGFIFCGAWKAKSTAGTVFNNIDLSRGEFADYDEEGNCPVIISNLRTKLMYDFKRKGFLY